MPQLNTNDVGAKRYVVQSLIGSGGMAHVYKAYDLKTKQMIALKVLKEEYTHDAEFLRRFNSEAQAVLNLSHENIVRSVDVGMYGDINYIALEYVSGQTLKEMIKQSAPFPDSQVIRIGSQLCDALSHAHERNIIHRDVKPQNVLMTQNNIAKIADFGIARFTDASTQTYQGAKVLGSVHYISPEQARGESVDQKGDIYSLGIVLYEMATGKLPFDSDNSVSVALKHIQEEMKPPREVNPNISEALESIIMKATRKNPAERYDNMRDMRRDLLKALGKPHEAVAKLEIAKRQLPPNYVLRRMIMVLGVVVILVGILLSVFFIGKSFAENSGQGEAVYIPKLVSKTEAEASEAAERSGLNFVVRSRVTREDVGEGVVFNQEPKAGTRGKQGDSVYVEISAGAPVVEMISVVGNTYDEAERLLTEWGMKIDSVFNEFSDRPEGTVLRQIPEAGTYVEAGESVELWISGDGAERETVPSVVNKGLQEALSVIHASGFSDIYVRRATAEQSKGVASETVVNQSPLGGEFVIPETRVEVWATAAVSPAFSADAALNIEISANDSQVLVINKEQGADYVLFDDVLPSGSQIIPITVTSATGDEKLVVTYVNGEEARRDMIKVTQKQ